MGLKGAEYIGSPAKRRLDVVGGLALAGCFLPAAAVVALEAMVEHRTFNPIFVQTRVGKDEKPIEIYKYESLRKNTDPTNLRSGSHHPGASPVGLLLRRSALDEMPQIVNVIRGDMSLVGIRPMPQEYLDYHQSLVGYELFSEWRECYDQNLGLTGPGQLFSKVYPDHTPQVIKRRMEIEVGAFANASLVSDLRTIAATPMTLLRQMIGGPPIPATQGFSSEEV